MVISDWLADGSHALDYGSFGFWSISVCCTVWLPWFAGTTASFISWAKALERRKEQHQEAAAAGGPATALPPLMLAAYGGCLTVRAAAVLTYKQMGRSMVAGDMVSHLGDRVLEHAGLLTSKL